MRMIGAWSAATWRDELRKTRDRIERPVAGIIMLSVVHRATDGR
jgi:hypothetical protein